VPGQTPLQRLVYVAAGSNIDAARRMQQAAGLLRERFPGARFSACWQNPAFGFAGEDFVNAVVELPTALALPELIAELHDIEARCGRGRDDPKWAPRAMDLDLLLDGTRIESTAEYRLPRPDLLKRAYMLLPLAELAGKLVHPTEHVSIAALAARWLQESANAQAAAAMQRMALDLNSA
jgi:2-amino-4-hydroxy-6-hydroxymethyldihydropteridine diphosphokinase